MIPSWAEHFGELDQNPTEPKLVWQSPVYKLDGVGPIDNRPSTDKLHHFVQKKNKKNDM